MKKVTYTQIAEALQTSRVTVWKALNNKPGIAPITKQKILMTAVELGYPISLLNDANINTELPKIRATLFPAEMPAETPNTILQVAVAVSRPETSNFWMSIIHYQAMALAQSNINLIYLYLPSTFRKKDVLPEALTNGSVSGVIIMNIYDQRLFQALNALPLPKVFLDCPTKIGFSELNGDLLLLEGVSSVDAIVERMIQRGRRRIHFIGDIAYAQTNKERYIGYLKAMQRHQLPVEQLPSLITPIGINTYRSSIEEFLDSLNPFPEAIVCASDYIAYLVITYCQTHNKQVPADVLVSGYDDITEFDTHVPLTTVHVNNERLGVRLANQLIHRILSPKDDFEFTYIRNQPIFRASTEA